jgi:hypothetical protein
MKAIYFIETNTGEKLYKCDTFWSKSYNHTNAKIHDDSEYDQKRFFDSLIYGFKPYDKEELDDEIFEAFKKYEGGLYGYQLVLTKNVDLYRLPDDVELSDPIYLTKIISISKSGKVENPTFEAYKRDLKINEILK